MASDYAEEIWNDRVVEETVNVEDASMFRSPQKMSSLGRAPCLLMKKRKTHMVEVEDEMAALPLRRWLNCQPFASQWLLARLPVRDV